MGSTRLAGMALWLLTLTHLMQMVLGWAFQVPPRIVEGANAEFQVVDDGGGFYYPYTMTVLKKVLSQPSQQVGLVYTDKPVFYWDCNQPAGTVLEFRLVSKANVNTASSGNMTVLPGAQAAASSVSVLSVASTASLFSQSVGSVSSTLATATPTTQAERSKGVSLGVIVGVSIAGTLLVVALLIGAWWIYRSRKPQETLEATLPQEDTITPFMHSQIQYTPPIGYTTPYTGSYDEPPEYAPPSQLGGVLSPSNSTAYPSTTYASTSAPSEGGRTHDMTELSSSYAPTRSEKRRH